MIEDENGYVGERSWNVRTVGTIVCCKVVKQTIVRKDCNLLWWSKSGSFSERKKNRNVLDVHLVPVVQSV